MADEGAAQQQAEPALRTQHGELVLLIAEQTRRVPIARYFTSACIAGLLLMYLPPLWPLLWLVTVNTVLALRTRTLRGLPDDDSLTDQQKLRRIAGVFVLSGVAQVVLVLFFPIVPMVMVAIISIFVVGLTAGTMHATVGYRDIYVPYLLVTMGPLAVAWGLSPGLAETVVERLLFVGLVLLFSSTLVSHARGAWGVFTESYNIRLQRINLTRRLQQALGVAESANRAKTRFLAAASHDLRQPIHALSLFSGSLLQRPLDTRATAIAGQIDKSVRTLANQMDALLDVSRLDAGVIERSLGTVDLRAMLGQLADEFAPQAAQKGLRLEMANAAPVSVRTDALLFLRIVRNLLSNAVKYTESGRIDVTVEVSGDRCTLRIRDTGPGIPPTEHERIFEEFYQLQNPERDRSKGLGLGLAIVRRLSDLLEVGLQFESAPDQGTCFALTVPLAVGAAACADPADAIATPAAEADGPRAARLDVLVVDDEEPIRIGMQTLLQGMGFGVRAVASMDEAVQAARTARPSIVLADFRLRQGEDGMRVIRELRLLWPDLPALLISGDTAPDRLREARDAGIPLLHKPVPPALLRESILRNVAA